MDSLVWIAEGTLNSDAIEEAITILVLRFRLDEETYRCMILEMVLVQQQMRSQIDRRVLLLVDHLLIQPTEPWRQAVSAHSLAESSGDWLRNNRRNRC